MANTIRDYSATAASNTVVDGADISEGCSPAGINDAIRGVIADLKDVSTGAVALESPAADSLTVTGNVGAATFSGDGSALTGIPTPTLTSLGIANHDDITVDGSGNLDVTGAITTDGLTSEAANGTITSKASGASFCSFTANTSAGNNAYVFFQQAGTEMSRITAFNGDALAFSTGSGATERLRIDSSGRVTMPYQPSFMAYGSWNYQASTYVWQGFATVDHNIGSHWNNNIGRFTAPVAGKYMIYATVHHSNVSTYHLWAFLKNGTAGGGNWVQSYDTGGGSATTSKQQVWNLAAGDYLEAASNATYANAYLGGYVAVGVYLIG